LFKLETFEEDSVKKSILILVLLVVVTAPSLLVACTESASPFTITDDLGREVLIKETPQAVVSLAPSITEILFALDLGDRVVGVTGDCDYPEEAKDKPDVGRYFSTSLESIVDKDPDLILTDGYDSVVDQLEGLEITMVVLQPTDIPGIFKDIQLVGEVMNEKDKAAELASGLQERLDAVKEKAAQAADQPTVFFEIDAYDPVRPWTAGPGSFADAMISLAGGQNIVQEGEAWLQISLEKLVSANPEIIILSDYPDVTPETVMARTGVWQQLLAVKEERVYAISDPSLTSRPGPRIIDGLEKLARIIHPELFST
jgi:iron complex transport system substrate-binding protein